MDDFLKPAISEVQAITLCQETTQDLAIDAGRVEETLGISWKIKDDNLSLYKEYESIQLDQSKGYSVQLVQSLIL